jgi:chromosome segregation ATPase
MAQDINELLERCEQRAFVLSQESDRALDGVSQIVQFATTLASNLSAASEEALGSFEALNSELQAAEQNLESELASAREGLSNLQEKAGQLQSQTEEELEQIKSQLAELESHQEEILTEVEQDSEITQASFDKLSQQAAVFESEVDTWEDSANSNIEALRGSVDEAKNSFNQHQTNLLEHFDTLGQDIGQRLENLMVDFGSLMEESSNQLIALNDALNTAPSDAIAAMNQKFTEALGEISSEAKRLASSLSALGEAGINDGERMNGRFAEVIDQIAEVAGHIEKILPILEDVEETLN